MQESDCSGGRNVLTESAEQRGAVVGVYRESTHQLACVLTDLREWIKGWMLLFGLVATLHALGVAII